MNDSDVSVTFGSGHKIVANPPQRNFIGRFFNEICPELNRSQKLYLFGVVISVISIVVLFFFQDKSILVFLTVGLLLLFFGVVSDGLVLYGKIWKTLIGRAAILIIYGAVGTLLYAYSSQIVNSVVGFESTQITKILPIVAVLLFPIVMSLVFFGVFIVSLVFMPFYLLYVDFTNKNSKNECLGKSLSKPEYLPYISAFSRIVIISFISSFLTQMYGKFDHKYTGFINSSVASLVYHFEAIEKSRCKVPEGYKSISINENEVIIIKPTDLGYLFETIRCKPIIGNVDANK